MQTPDRENGRANGSGRLDHGAAAARKAAGYQGAVRPPAQAYRPLVLVVEDDPHDFEIYGRILWYNGFNVLYAADGESALHMARRHRPDLILLDFVLPKLDGLSVCRRLKEHSGTAQIPVVALTGQSQKDLQAVIEPLGLANFLEKPIGPVDVLHAIEALVGRAPLPGLRIVEARRVRTDAA